MFLVFELGMDLSTELLKSESKSLGRFSLSCEFKLDYLAEAILRVRFYF